MTCVSPYQRRIREVGTVEEYDGILQSHRGSPPAFVQPFYLVEEWTECSCPDCEPIGHWRYLAASSDKNEMVGVAGWPKGDVLWKP